MAPADEHQVSVSGGAVHRAGLRDLGDAAFGTPNITSAFRDLIPAKESESEVLAIRARAAGSLTAVRLTEFWRRMDEQFGSAYAHSVAKDYVLAGLGGRTINQALADGDDVKKIWRAVCAAFPVPERLR